MIQLQQLTSDDIQAMLTKLQDDGASYSTIKKAHDCIGAVLKHAFAAKAVSSNPMQLVEMPSKALFEQKEIRVFTKEEARLITEESGRPVSAAPGDYPRTFSIVLPV